MASRFRRRRRINIADNGKSRVFIHWCCIGDVDHVPCIGIDTVQVSNSEPTNIYCPSSKQYDKFDIVKVVDGDEGRYTSTMLTRMSMDDISFFHQLFALKCPIDISIHFGECHNPADFYGYTKMIVFKNVRLNSYNLDALVAIQTADRGEINETVGISFDRMLMVRAIDVLTETRIATTTVNSLSILRSNLCQACSACAVCACSNLGINSVGLQNAIISWQDDGNKLIFVTDTGVITVIAADDYINNQVVTPIDNSNLVLGGGEVVTTGAFRLVGTNLGKIIKIAKGRVATTLFDTNGIEITALYHKQYGDLIAGDINGNLYIGSPETIIYPLPNSPTNVAISAVAVCDGNYIVSDVSGNLFTSIDGGTTWVTHISPFITTPILSIDCCDCFHFFLGTQQALLYSANGLNDFQVIHDDYVNYKQVLCCDETGDAVILAEDNADSIILATNMFETLT